MIITDIKNGEITVGEILETDGGKALLMREFPSVAKSPLLLLAKKMSLNAAVSRWGKKVSEEKIKYLITEIEKL